MRRRELCRLLKLDMRDWIDNLSQGLLDDRLRWILCRSCKRFEGHGWPLIVKLLEDRVDAAGDTIWRSYLYSGPQRLKQADSARAPANHILLLRGRSLRAL